jgi:hypothetical protein
MRHALKIRFDISQPFPSNTQAAKFLNWMKGNANFSLFADFTLGDLLVPSLNPVDIAKKIAKKEKIETPKFEASPNLTVQGTILAFPFQMLYLGVNAKPKSSGKKGLAFSLKVFGQVINSKNGESVNENQDSTGERIKEQAAAMKKKLKDWVMDAKKVTGRNPEIPIFPPIVMKINFGFTFGAGYGVTFGVGNDAFNFEGGISGRYNHTEESQAGAPGPDFWKTTGTPKGSRSSSDEDWSPRISAFGQNIDTQNLKKKYQDLRDQRDRQFKDRISGAGRQIQDELNSYAPGLADQVVQGMNRDIAMDLIDPGLLSQYVSGERGPPMIFDVNAFKESLRETGDSLGQTFSRDGANQFVNGLKGKGDDLKKKLLSDVRIKIGGDVYTSLSFWLMVTLGVDLKIASLGAGIRGNLVLFRANAGADVRASTGSQFVDLVFNYGLSIMSGTVDVVWWVKTPIYNWDGTYLLVSFPGWSFGDSIDPFARLDLRAPAGSPSVFMCVDKNSDPRCRAGKVYVAASTEQDLNQKTEKLTGEKAYDPNGRFAVFTDGTMICSEASQSPECVQAIQATSSVIKPATVNRKDFPAFTRLMQQFPQIAITHQMDKDGYPVKAFAIEDAQSASIPSIHWVKSPVQFASTVTGEKIDFSGSLQNLTQKKAIREVTATAPNEVDRMEFNPLPSVLDWYPDAPTTIKHNNVIKPFCRSENLPANCYSANHTQTGIVVDGWIKVRGPLEDQAFVGKKVFVDDVRYLPNRVLVDMASRNQLGACSSNPVKTGVLAEDIKILAGVVPPDDRMGPEGSVRNLTGQIAPCFLPNNFSEDELYSAAACWLRKAHFEGRCFTQDKSDIQLLIANMSDQQIVKELFEENTLVNSMVGVSISPRGARTGYTMVSPDHPSGGAGQQPYLLGDYSHFSSFQVSATLNLLPDMPPANPGLDPLRYIPISWDKSSWLSQDQGEAPSSFENGEPICLNDGTADRIRTGTGSQGASVPTRGPGGASSGWDNGNGTWDTVQDFNYVTNDTNGIVSISSCSLTVQGPAWNPTLNENQCYFYRLYPFQSNDLQITQSSLTYHVKRLNAPNIQNPIISYHIPKCGTWTPHGRPSGLFARKIWGANSLETFEFTDLPLRDGIQSSLSLDLRTLLNGYSTQSIPPADRLDPTWFSHAPTNHCPTSKCGHTLSAANFITFEEGGDSDGDDLKTALETEIQTSLQTHLNSWLQARLGSNTDNPFRSYLAGRMANCVNQGVCPYISNLIPVDAQGDGVNRICRIDATKGSITHTYQGSSTGSSLEDCATNSIPSLETFCKTGSPMPINPTSPAIAAFITASPTESITLSARYIEERSTETIDPVTNSNVARTIQTQEIGKCTVQNGSIVALTTQAGGDRGPANATGTFNAQCSTYAKTSPQANSPQTLELSAKIVDQLVEVGTAEGGSGVSPLHECASSLTAAEFPLDIGVTVETDPDLVRYRRETCLTLPNSVITKIVPPEVGLDPNRTNYLATLEARYQPPPPGTLQSMSLGECSIDLRAARARSGTSGVLDYSRSCDLVLMNGNAPLTLDTLKINYNAGVNFNNACQNAISQKHGVDLCQAAYKNPRYATVHSLLPQNFDVKILLGDDPIGTSVNCSKQNPNRPKTVVKTSQFTQSDCRTYFTRLVNGVQSAVGQSSSWESTWGWIHENNLPSYTYGANGCKNIVFDELLNPDLSAPRTPFVCADLAKLLEGETAPTVSSEVRGIRVSTSGEPNTRTFTCEYRYKNGRWITKLQFDTEAAVQAQYGYGSYGSCDLTSDQRSPLLSPSSTLGPNQYYLVGGNGNRLIQTSVGALNFNASQLLDLCRTRVLPGIGLASSGNPISDLLTPNAGGQIELRVGQTDEIGCPKVAYSQLPVIGTCPIETCSMVTDSGEVLSELGTGNTSMLLRFFRPTNAQQCRDELSKEVITQCMKLEKRSDFNPFLSNSLYAKYGSQLTPIGACASGEANLPQFKCELHAMEKTNSWMSFFAAERSLVRIQNQLEVVGQSLGDSELAVPTYTPLNDDRCYQKLHSSMEAADYCGYAREQTGFGPDDSFDLVMKSSTQPGLIARSCYGRPTGQIVERLTNEMDPITGQPLKIVDEYLQVHLSDIQKTQMLGTTRTLRGLVLGRPGAQPTDPYDVEVVREWAPYARESEATWIDDPSVFEFRFWPKSLFDLLKLAAGKEVNDSVYYPGVGMDHPSPLYVRREELTLELPADRRSVLLRTRLESPDQLHQSNWLDFVWMEPPPTPSPTPSPSTSTSPVVEPPSGPRKCDKAVFHEELLPAFEEYGIDIGHALSSDQLIEYIVKALGWDPRVSQDRSVWDTLLRERDLASGRAISLKEWLVLLDCYGYRMVDLTSGGGDSGGEITDETMKVWIEKLEASGFGSDSEHTVEEWIKIFAKVVDPNRGSVSPEKAYELLRVIGMDPSGGLNRDTWLKIAAQLSSSQGDGSVSGDSGKGNKVLNETLMDSIEGLNTKEVVE